MDSEPTVRDPDWLRDHVTDILQFYYPACMDHERGGYIHQFSDRTAEIYDRDPKHLVGTCRFIFNFAIGAKLDGPDWCRPTAAHGVEFLSDAHWDSTYGGYTWALDGTTIADGTKYCYGHAFTLLAYAVAAAIGIDGASEKVTETYELIEDRFWEPEHGLCRTEVSRDWSTESPYRGQNGNMHMCEAMLAAHEATGQPRYLDRAATIADAITRRLASPADGQIWEHYDQDWNHDWSYNRDDPENLFRPWGYLIGHQAEWAKLLLILDERRPAEWHLERARALFETAVNGWDETQGGLYYTVDRDGNVVDDRKFYWVPAETIGAAALLAARTDDATYWDWYARLWEYSWDHLINHDLGIWYRVLTRDHEMVDNIDLPTRVKTDYHGVNAAYEGIRAIQED